MIVITQAIGTHTLRLSFIQVKDSQRQKQKVVVLKKLECFKVCDIQHHYSYQEGQNTQNDISGQKHDFLAIYTKQSNDFSDLRHDTT